MYGAHQSGSVVRQAAGLFLGAVCDDCGWKPFSVRKTHLFRSVSSMRGCEGPILRDRAAKEVYRAQRGVRSVFEMEEGCGCGGGHRINCVYSQLV